MIFTTKRQIFFNLTQMKFNKTLLNLNYILTKKAYKQEECIKHLILLFCYIKLWFYTILFTLY